MATAIKVENLSKIYRLGEIGTGTISRDIERFVKTKILKQDDPFLKIGETNDRATKGSSDIVYSLKDINFEIEQGDAVGIIGRNGAGKSTLLKILSRVTSPTTGKINIKGRVASLLEVGTGFHPELTGRENIYLNGAILGMRKREIDRKLDEIIDFSGVERYIDTPVKRYSSGMYVRLAFAVAAHLESEILIVDEVLAVGDAEFQKKCLGKMSDVSKGEGRTLLFVSHNVGAIMEICNSCMLISNGNLIGYGSTSEELIKYQNQNGENLFIDNLFCLDIAKLFFFGFKNSATNKFSIDEDLIIEIILELYEEIADLLVALNIFSQFNHPLIRISYNDYNHKRTLKKGKSEIKFKIPKFHLAVGKYQVELDFAIPNEKKLIENIRLDFEIHSNGTLGDKYKSRDSKLHNSIIRPNWLIGIN